MGTHLSARTHAIAATTCLLTSLGAGNGCHERVNHDDSAIGEAALGVEHLSDSRRKRKEESRSHHDRTYIPDCNDPLSGDATTCIHPSEIVLEGARARGYPNYVGHDEPSVLFFSSAANSGSNMQWKFL